jgi:hypothetical protein
MSRGPGKWQRIILGALKTSEWRYLHDLIPYQRKTYETWLPTGKNQPRWGEDWYLGLTDTDRLAALRAAHTLAARGQITLYTSRKRMCPTIVARPGVTLDHWQHAMKPSHFFHGRERYGYKG